MSELDGAALDRWITGNYGADDPACQPCETCNGEGCPDCMEEENDDDE